MGWLVRSTEGGFLFSSLLCDFLLSPKFSWGLYHLPSSLIGSVCFLMVFVFVSLL